MTFYYDLSHTQILCVKSLYSQLVITILHHL